MNAERLLTYVGWLLTDEREHKVQEALTATKDALANLVSSPSEGSYQSSLVESVQTLRNRIKTLVETYDSVQAARVFELGAKPFFSMQLAADVDAAIRENAMTPAVALEVVSKLEADRSAYLSSLRSASQSLRALSISYTPMEVNTAEVGFRLPGSLFNDDLDGLVGELRQLRRTIRAFSEIATGSSEKIIVKQISSTDPTFYLQVGVYTIKHIGSAVSWALDQWKKLEEIRKIRAETERLAFFEPEEIRKIYDEKIKQVVDAAIAAKVTELIGTSTAPGRIAEQRIDLSWALESMLARIERGMTVEIRYNIEAQDAEDENDVRNADNLKAQFEAINNTLSFPQVQASPILQLPSYSEQVKGGDGDHPNEAA